MCVEEVLRECHKEARRNGLKLVPERMAGLYSVADKATNQVVSPYPMNPYSIHEWMTEYTAQA